MQSRVAAAFASVLLAAAAAVGALADDFPGKVEAQPEGLGVGAPGGRVALRVDVDLEPTFHLYGLAQKDAIVPSFKAGKGGWPAGLSPLPATEAPAPETKTFDSGTYLVHEGRCSFTLPFAIAADAAPGPRTVDGEIELQVCDENTCRLPERIPFSVTLHVTEPSTVSVVRTEFVPGSAAPGGVATVEIELALAPKWHVYAQRHPEYQPPKFTWTLPPGFAVKGDVVEVTPPHEVDYFGEKLFVFETKAVLRQAFDVPAGAAPGQVAIQGLGAWQRCDDTGCSNDKDVPLAAMLVIAADAPAGVPAAPAGPAAPAPAAGSPAADAPSQSLVDVLLSGMVWGFITILTPCVFPLLPVTVSFFAKQEGPALPRSIVYAAGIVFTITVIGLIFKSGLDTMARGSAFNLFVGALFFVLALSLFGLFELRLPSFLIDRAQARGAAGGLLGPFFMAVTLALTSFSCSVPFLAIMFTRFDDGAILHAIAGLVAYGCTLALPFFLCSLFPSMLKGLPRSGGWLNAVKVTMGFVELGLAFKFLRTVALNNGSDLLPRALVLAIWTACAIAAALYLFGYITLPHDTKAESIGVVRLLFAVGFVTMALYLVPGLFGVPLNAQLEGFIQSEEKDFRVASAADGGGHGGTAAAEAHHWPRDDWDGALARAAEKKRPALFDFTGVG